MLYFKENGQFKGNAHCFSGYSSKYAQIDPKMQEKWNHPLQILYILLLKHIRLRFSSLLMQDFPLDKVFKKELY
jgi:hypothetical protein